MAALKNSYQRWSMKSSQIIFLFVLVFNVGCFQLTPKPQSTEPETTKSESEKPDGITTETSSFHYQFNDNVEGEICSTGMIDAITFDDICKKLNDEEMNRSCAIDMRSELFYNYECPGVFTYPQAVAIETNTDENTEENVDLNTEPTVGEYVEPTVEEYIEPIPVEAPVSQSEVTIGEDNVIYSAPVLIPSNE